MKNNLIALLLILFIASNSFAQAERTAMLETLEQSTQNPQPSGTTATLKSASRLFDQKDDLTTVILIIPSGTTVEVLEADSTYLFVNYEETSGYIFNRNLTINSSAPVNNNTQANQQNDVVQQSDQVQQNTVQPVNRFTQLENKYGTSVGSALYSGKIWKGMSTEMVLDSWGTPVKINRSISSNIVKEEWIYNNTWLFFENDRLIEWGPVRR